MLLKRLLALLCAAMLLPVAALADGPTTYGEIEAIWQESFEKMGTFYYLIQPGPLPTEDELTLEDALSIAKNAILNKYGTPAEDLDSIGLYPEFYYGIWIISWNPLTDKHLSGDPAHHDNGEYRVTIDASSGEIITCRWYIEDFWTHAQALWDEGRYDMVYKQAQRSAFYKQTTQEQEHFRTLLAEAGYDMSVIKADGSLMDDEAFQDEIFYFNLSLAVNAEDDERVATAWQAIEDTYSLNTELMRQYHYLAFYSPLNTGTQDIIISHHQRWSLVSEHLQAWEAEHGDATDWIYAISHYLERLGTFMVQLDPETGEVLSTAHRAYDYDDEEEGDPSLVLGRPTWNADDLNEWYEIAQEYAAFMTQAEACPEISDELLEMLSDALMRSYGGSRFLYPSRLKDWDDIDAEEALSIAIDMAADCFGMSVTDVLTYYEPSDPWYSFEYAVYYCSFEALPNIPEDAEPGVIIEIDAATGEVLYYEYSSL